MLPYLTEVQNPSKKYTVSFRGLNYGEGTSDGEFAETYNLSTDQYPCITQRAARISVKKYNQPSTLHSKGNLLVIDGTDVYYGDTKVGEVEAGKKQTATIGNYIVIFPDKKYYKVPTEDDKEGKFGSMEVEYRASGLSFTSSKITRAGAFPFIDGDIVTISGCATDENNKEGLTLKSAADDELTFDDNTFAEAAEDGEITIKRDEIIYKAKYMTFTSSTISRTTGYGGNFPFKKGDIVTISYSGNTFTDVVIKAATPNVLTFADKTFTTTGDMGAIEITIVCKGAEYKGSALTFKSSTISKEGAFPFAKGDSVTIKGCSNNDNNKEEEIIIRSVTSDEITFDDYTFTTVANEENVVTISRTVPPLDFICESNYRLWGTHGNTIYSSKFSDPLNFKSFEGLAGDSYAIDVASEGEFTGCIPYSSHICFFKENTLHKLYGTKPSNFQVTTVNVYGVQSGSERSMQIVNEQLLYKGVGGVYSYTGGVPELISEKFGTKRYSDAVACCDGEKYYISMKQGDNWSMFAYDVAKNIWLREDDTQAVDMTFYDGKVYFLDARGGLYYIDKTADRSGIEWGATFCTMHETMNERKGYSKFHLRMDLSAGAWLAVDIKTDNDLQWQQVYTTHNEKAKTVSIPIMPTRCDSIDIRLRGKGKCTVKTFVREFSVGSDV
jgi:DNA/RNA endonuclease YhcR with UshA esterase domain